MNRRSFLSFLGLAPVAAPAAVASASASIDYSDLVSAARVRIDDAAAVIDVRRDGSSKVTIDAGRFQIRASVDNKLAERFSALMVAAGA